MSCSTLGSRADNILFGASNRASGGDGRGSVGRRRCTVWTAFNGRRCAARNGPWLARGLMSE